MLLVTTFSTAITSLSSLYVHLTQCVKLLSKDIETNLKHLLRTELVTDVSFLVLSLVNNDLFIHVFATSVGCDIRYVGTAELKNIPYISASVTYTIKISVKETWILRLTHLLPMYPFCNP